jgi:hypothetical protein
VNRRVWIFGVIATVTALSMASVAVAFDAQGVGNDFIDGVDGISGNEELGGGRGIDHCVGDEDDTFPYCDGNVVEVPSGTQSAK